MASSANPCRWVTLQEALTAFALRVEKTESQGHIRPLHWFVACRLVVEGGFLPEEITPRPPFEAKRGRGGWTLHYVPERGGTGEQTVLGGLKTKVIDVTVAKPGIGPCLAVSIKGTLKSFRNLTNRMEEAIGDCTNLHIAYPNLVYAFLHVLRGNQEGPVQPEEAAFLVAETDGTIKTSDIAIRKDQTVAEGIQRYQASLSGLTGRSGIRNDLTRYESVGLGLVRPRPPSIIKEWPPATSPLHFEQAFGRMYDEYDRRYVYAAPRLAGKTKRVEWRKDSPALAEPAARDYEARTK